MASTSGAPPDRRGEPRWAALLTWFVPGAGHVYLGAPVFGLVAFAIVQGLYVLGLRLTDGMLFEYLEPDLRGPYAGALTPEVGNLGMLVYHMKAFGYGEGLPRSWPPHMHLGAWLTATSGFLNACLIARAYMDAARPRTAPVAKRSPATLVVLAWLVPGLAHVLQGRKLRGALVAVALIGLFALGTLLSEGSNLDRERHFYYWAGQFLIGAPAMIAEALHGHALVRSEIPYVDGGLGMACVAGLLNVLAMIDVVNFEDRAGQPAPEAPRPAATVPAPPGATQPGSLA